MHPPITKAEIQQLRSLREKKHREALGRFVVEGAKVVAELLAAGFPFEVVYAAPGAAPPAVVPPGTRVVEISAADMARISHFPTPSPLLAVGRMERPPLEVSALATGLTLALDGVQDAGNVGTLLRIADWFGCARVLLSPDCADLFHQKVINASMGSFARVPAHAVDLAATLAQARAASAGLPVLGCDLDGRDVHTLPTLRHAILVVGSEGRGLSVAVRDQLTERVTIPRLGHAESLNAAVAAAIVCDNLRRPGAKDVTQAQA